MFLEFLGFAGSDTEYPRDGRRKGHLAKQGYAALRSRLALLAHDCVGIASRLRSTSERTVKRPEQPTMLDHQDNNHAENGCGRQGEM
jgi:hypothetical protein